MKKLVIKLVDDNLQGYGGFQYPESGSVEAPDFKPTKECGNGLHGLLEGKGDWGYLELNNKTTMLLIEVEEEDIVDLGDKVKFKKGNVIKVGNIAEIVGELVKAGVWKDNSQCKTTGKDKRIKKAENVVGYNTYDAVINTFGNRAISDGTYSVAFTCSAWTNGQAINYGLGGAAIAVGDWSRAKVFYNDATAINLGDHGEASTKEKNSVALSRGRGIITKSYGENSVAVGIGPRGKVVSTGNTSKAVCVGDYCEVEATGEDSLACVVGLAGCVRVGEGGVFTLPYRDNTGKLNVAVGRVGVDGIKANTWYKVNRKGQLVESCKE